MSALSAGITLATEATGMITRVIGEWQTNKKLDRNEERRKELEEECNKMKLNLKELELKRQQQESEAKLEQKRQKETLIYEREKTELTCKIEAKILEIERLKEDQQLSAAQFDKEKEKGEEMKGKMSKLYEENVTLRIENQGMATASQIQTLENELNYEKKLGSISGKQVSTEEKLKIALNVSLRDSIRLVSTIGNYIEIIPFLQRRLRQKKDTRYLLAFVPLVVLFLTLLSSTPLTALLFWTIVSLLLFCVLTGYIEWPTKQNSTDIVEMKVNELLEKINNAINQDTSTPLFGAHELLSKESMRSIQGALQERGRILQELQMSAQEISAAIKDGLIEESKVTSLEQCFIASQEYLNKYGHSLLLLSSTAPNETLDIAEFPIEAREAIE